MRKRLIPHESPPSPAELAAWLDLESLARVEITSEDPDHPIERALRPGDSGGWQALRPGRQTIRLLFDAPQTIRLIQLCFREECVDRAQEFLLRWSETGEEPFHDILRQGFHFSPPGTVEEIENYRVTLNGVKGLEVSILPDGSGKTVRATLAALRIA